MLGKEFYLLSEVACVCIYVFMYLYSFYLIVLAGSYKHMSKVLILRAAPVIPFLTSQVATSSFQLSPLDMSLIFFCPYCQVWFSSSSFMYISCPGPRISHFSKKSCFLLVANDYFETTSGCQGCSLLLGCSCLWSFLILK